MITSARREEGRVEEMDWTDLSRDNSERCIRITRKGKDVGQ